MATISKDTAEKIVKNKGRYSDDPPAYAVIEFDNSYFGSVNYAVCYSENEYISYKQEHRIRKILWPEKEALS